MPRPKSPSQCALDELPRAKREQLARGTLEAVRRWVKAQEAGNEKKGETENERETI